MLKAKYDKIRKHINQTKTYKSFMYVIKLYNIKLFKYQEQPNKRTDKRRQLIRRSFYRNARSQSSFSQNRNQNFLEAILTSDK